MWLSKPPAGIQLNRNHPLAQGLVGCWLFNEGAGLRANDTVNINNFGKLISFEPMSSTQGWIGGKYGTSIIFNGISSYINTYRPTFGTSSFSFSAWFNTSTSQSNRWATGLFNSGSTPNNLSLGMFIQDVNVNGNNKMSYWFRDSNGVSSTLTDVSPSACNDEKWHHYAVVVDRSQNNIFGYYDGILRTTESRTFTGTFTADVRNIFIGASHDNAGNPTTFWKGIISNEQIWSRALNPIEIQQLYAQPFAMFWNPSERIRKNYDNEILI